MNVASMNQFMRAPNSGGDGAKGMSSKSLTQMNHHFAESFIIS